jgi:glucose-6-phosphate isomerase
MLVASARHRVALSSSVQSDAIPMATLPDSAALQPLNERKRALLASTLAHLFDADPTRTERLAIVWDGWRADCTKERLDVATLELLDQHARGCGLPGWIAALLAGEKINLTERRPALHTALRQQDDTPIVVDGTDVVPLIRSAQARMRALADDLLSGQRRGGTGRAFTHVVNIGIGGSDLGPRLVCDALAPLATDSPEQGLPVAFVSNVDPEHLSRALAPLDPATTLIVVTSKTFTTQETLANATSAKTWLARTLQREDVASHFVAVTGNAAAAQAFGIAADDVLPLWDWVGGRYSLWSPAGLAIVLRLGYQRFAELLAGAASVDAHFATAPFTRNIPAMLGFIGYWNTRHLGHTQRVVVPYAQTLAYLPMYLQQLVLESNGKCVARDGAPVSGPTSPALWGAPGTDGQHAFFQWLHQGTRETPVEFVVPVRATHPLGDQQRLLVANAIAQAQALLEGRSEAAVRAALEASGEQGVDLDMAVAARVCPGNRASTTLMMPEVNAHRLGQLIAIYEHRTFVEAVLFGINPFDQFGVELGKTLARPVIDALAGTSTLPQRIDASTRALVEHARSLHKP